MRLFIAVELDEAIRKNAAAIGERLAAALGPAARHGVSWVAPANMHLTVRFLGEVREAVAEELRGRLSRPLRTPAFRLSVSGLGAFPPSGPPRVFWLGLTEGAQDLALVHDEVEERLEGLGFEKEDRPFRAHLTLARVKAPLGPVRQVLASIGQADAGSCTVSQVTLFQSRLSPRGATYTALAHGLLRTREI